MTDLYVHKVFAAALSVPVVAWVLGMLTADSRTLAVSVMLSPGLVGIWRWGQGWVSEKRGQSIEKGPMNTIFAALLLMSWLCGFVGGRLIAVGPTSQAMITAVSLMVAICAALIRLRRSPPDG